MKFDFKQIMLNIQSKSYQYLGSGSGRRVFDLENGYVVKVAKNRKGLAQNKAEYYISFNSQSNLFAAIPVASSNFGFLIMQKADSIKNFSEVWSYYNVRNNRELFRLKEFKDIIYQFNLLIPDLIRPSNWGKIGERPVIIDYGFTARVRRQYYSHW